MSELHDARRGFFAEFSTPMTPNEFLDKWERFAPNPKNNRLKKDLLEMVALTDEQRIVAGFMLRRQAAQLVEDADRRDLCFLAAVMEPDYDSPTWEQPPQEQPPTNEFDVLLEAGRCGHAFALSKYPKHSLGVIKHQRQRSN